MNPSTNKPSVHGLMVEFEDSDELLAAIGKVRQAGYQRMDAYAPFPVEGLSEALGLRKSIMPTLIFCGGLIGCLAGFGLEYYASVLNYPVNIAGRPLNTWPMFIPPMFETTVLFAGLTAVFGMFGLCGFPMPYHPVFNAPRFDLASQTHFFLCIEATDPKFELNGTRRFLESLGARGVTEVEP